MTTPGTGSGPAIGSLADEAGQLIDAVTARLTRLKAEAAVIGPGAAGSATEAVHTCVGWCPICRGADILRGDRSEISEKLVDTALLVLTTLRSLVPEPPSASTADGSPNTEPADRPGVERIDIR
jgi:hypothetical protein